MERLRSHGNEVEEMGNLEESLSPEDIDIIIATHLHVEQIASARDFPITRIIVQKKERIGALNPCHVLQSSTPGGYKTSNRFELVDGDVEIEPGIMIMLTPGHSAGGQSVLLQLVIRRSS